jgi:hypothetical protein
VESTKAATGYTPVLEHSAFYTGKYPTISTLAIRSTAGSGTMVGTFTLWGYLTASDSWYEIPVNGGTAVTPVALAETESDRITFVETFDSLGSFDRLYLELSSVGGTGTTFEAFLITPATSF